MVKRVIVNNKYTYETDLPVKIGDKVELPSPASQIDPDNDATWEGTVTALTSHYTGPCIQILCIVGQSNDV